MTARITTLGRIDKPIRFLGRLTLRDAARIGLPTAAGTILGGVPGALIGGGIGAASTTVNRFDKPVEEVAASAAQHYLRGGFQEDRAVEVDDSHIVLETGRCLGVVQVNPTSLGMRHDDEQLAVTSAYRDLLYTVNQPFEVHSRQLPLTLSRYLDQLESQDSKLAKDYAELCNRAGDDALVSTQHYIVLPADSPETAEDRSRQVQDQLNTPALGTTRLTGQELERFTAAFAQEEVDPDWHGYEVPGGAVGRHRKMAYVHELPSSLPLGWTANVLQVDGVVDIVQRIEPVPARTGRRKLDRLKAKLMGEIESRLGSGFVNTNELETALNDVEYVLNRMANGEEELYQYAAYVIAQGSTPGECEATFDRVTRELARKGVEYRIPAFRGANAYRTESALHGDRLGEWMYQHGRGVEAGFPFATQKTTTQQGVLFGTESEGGAPVILDRWKWDVGHIVKLGRTGSGKTAHTIAEILRSNLAYNNLSIHVIDPKQDYAEAAAEVDGTVHGTENGSADSNTGIHVYQPEDRGRPDINDRLAEVIEDLHSLVTGDRRRTLVVVDEAHRLLEHPDGRTVLTQLVREARDAATAVTLASQNIREFAGTDAGQVILDNTPAVFLFYIRRVPGETVKQFDLSKRERETIMSLKTGTDSLYSEAVVKIDRELAAKLQIELTPPEHDLIGEGWWQ